MPTKDLMQTAWEPQTTALQGLTMTDSRAFAKARDSVKIPADFKGTPRRDHDGQRRSSPIASANTSARQRVPRHLHRRQLQEARRLFTKGLAAAPEDSSAASARLMTVLRGK